MKLEPMSPRASLVTDVTDQLAQSIQRDLRPGDRMPAENDIARQLGVSRPVVREALAFLRADGLVETRRGQGLYVSHQEVLRIRSEDVSSSNISIIELLELRRGLEGETVRMAAERRTPDDIERLRARLNAIHEAEAAGRDGVEEDLDFHIEIARISRNSLHIKVMRFLTSTLRTAISKMRADDEKRPDYIATRRDRHDAIAALVIEGKADKAHRAMIEHMSETIERYGKLLQ